MAQGVFEVYNWVKEYSAEARQLTLWGANTGGRDIIELPEDTLHLYITVMHQSFRGNSYWVIEDAQGTPVEWIVRCHIGVQYSASQSIVPFRPRRITAIGTIANTSMTKGTLGNAQGRQTIHLFAYGV